MFTIEWQTVESLSYRSWIASTARYRDFNQASNAASVWMTANHKHGVSIQVRVVAVAVATTADLAEAA